MKIDTSLPQDEDDPLYGALTYPIFQTSAYLLPKGERFRYSRENNPTVEALAQKISQLENLPAGNAFSSGMAAITTSLLASLRPGNIVLIQRDMFARTFKFITSFLSEFNIKAIVADPGTTGILESLTDDVDLVFVETITNPVLRVNNIKEIAEKCEDSNTKLFVDSTFTTPYNILPGNLGADLVIHSASKYLSGHNDLIAGVLAGSDEIVSGIDDMRRTLGGSIDPHTAFLVMRGIKTLGIRMERINSNAMKLAEALSGTKEIRKTIYPGLESHPDYDVARETLRGSGGVVSIDLGTTAEETLKFIGRLKLIMPANTLGGVTTTVSHPSTMSHRGLTEEERLKAGVTPGLLRISAGIEDFDDILTDIMQALS